jgi:ferric-dicitrate binding protein FerR (iron transport regulator)
MLHMIDIKTGRTKHTDDSRALARAAWVIEALTDETTPQEFRAVMSEWFVNEVDESEKMEAMEEYMHRTLVPEAAPDEFVAGMFEDFKRHHGIGPAAPAAPLALKGNIRPLYRRAYSRVVSAAAVVLVVIGAAFGIVFRNGARPDEADMVASAESDIRRMKVKAGGEVVFSDGTKVWLNAGGRIVCPERFEGGERRVKLEGEAYFEVQRDSTREFIVQTSALDVRVLGTKFNVTENATNRMTSVTLDEGSVEVRAGKRMMRIKPGERLTCNHDTDEVAVAVVEPEELQACDWRSEKIFVKKKTIPEILKTIGYCYGINITFDTAALPTGSYSFSFNRADSPETVLGVLSEICGGLLFEKQLDGSIATS